MSVIKSYCMMIAEGLEDILGEISGLYYKHIMIVIDAASVVRK